MIRMAVTKQMSSAIIGPKGSNARAIREESAPWKLLFECVFVCHYWVVFYMFFYSLIGCTRVYLSCFSIFWFLLERFLNSPFSKLLLFFWGPGEGRKHEQNFSIGINGFGMVYSTAVV